MHQNTLKNQVALTALEYIRPHIGKDSIVGVGTGSTVNFFIDHLATIKNYFDGAIASSETTSERLKKQGIPVYELNNIDQMEFYIDGADETNSNFELIKGGGAALTREKIVAAVAKKFICIVDESKQVGLLGTFPLPVEVIPMARSYVAREIVKLGGDPVLREGVTTDNGNQIIDIYNIEILQPIDLEKRLNQITGVVCNGLFALRPADMLLIGTKEGVVKKVRQ